MRNPRREGVNITFKGETGNMVPIVCCQEHENSKRELYDVCETDETGEVRDIQTFQALGLLTADMLLKTALQVYCRTYKQAPVTQAHALLRKARRLDQTLNIRTDGPSSADGLAEPVLQCDMCSTQHSPAFYRSEHCRWRCHKCHSEHLWPEDNALSTSPANSLSPLDDTMDV